MQELLGIVVLVVLGYLIYQYKRKTGGGLFAMLFRNTALRSKHKHGQALVKQELRFAANAPIAKVREAILAKVGAESAPPKLVAKLYIVESSPSRIVFAFGNKLQTYFQSELRLYATKAGNATEGTWRILNWLEQDGFINSYPAMEQTIDQINAALSGLDQNAALRPTNGVSYTSSSGTTSSFVRDASAKSAPSAWTAISNWLDTGLGLSNPQLVPPPANITAVPDTPSTAPSGHMSLDVHLANPSPATALSHPKAGQGLDIFATDQAPANSLAIFNRTRLLLLEQLNSHGMGIIHIKTNSSSETSSLFEADILPAGEVFLARGKNAASPDTSPASAYPSVQLILIDLQISSDDVRSMLREIMSNLQKEFEGIVVRESFSSENAVRSTLQYKSAPHQTGLRNPKVESTGSPDRWEEGGMEFLKNAFSFDGRVRRITFWANLLVLLPISFFLNQRYVHQYTSFYDLQEHTYITNKPIYFTAMAVIGLRVLSISVRRWHDLDKSGWLAALNLFVVANNAELIDLSDSLYWITLFLSAGISLVILGFQGFVPGDEGPNQYGPPPEDGQLW